jgi:hypothetical protein
MLLRIIEPGLSPQLTGDLNGVDAGRLPPGLLVPGAMDGAVMRAAERNGEFVARFAAERPWLQVAKMMRIGLFAAADETCLLGDRLLGLKGDRPLAMHAIATLSIAGLSQRHSRLAVPRHKRVFVS